MSTVKRFVPGVLLFALLGLALPAIAQTGGMQNGPFDGMSAGIVVPAAVRADGKNGAFFQTDLWIRCRTVPVAATLYFHAADAASATPTVTVPVTLTQPVTYLPDILSATFGVSKGAGNIRIVAAAPVSAVLRVYNNGGGGAFGLSFMGMPSTMSLQSMPMMGGSFGMDDFAMYMLGLLPEPGNRVNVSVVNTNSTTVNGVVEVLDSDGLAPTGTGVTSLPFSIAGYSSHQFNDVLLNVHSRFGSGDTGLQIRVRLNQGSAGMVMSYAVVNDNTTNDGYVVMGNMMNGGRGMGMMN
ncbi:MAG TPA: hypothetical protein PLB01_03880 [Thermoanaerobaculia bacterium]|nr:hypothetical protein [Thermoanaerobaculia bacterium]